MEGDRECPSRVRNRLSQTRRKCQCLRPRAIHDHGMINNPFVPLPPDSVRVAATEITRPHDPRTHWSRVAALLGAVEDRQLYQEWGHRSVRAYAEQELDLAPSDTHELLKLYRVVQAANRPLEDWALISKGKARVLARALHLGGDLGAWIERALSSATEAALRTILQQQLGEETFTPYTIHIPASLEPLVQAAMLKALPIAVEEELPADLDAQLALVMRRENHFRCLEVLCASFLT